MSQPSRSQFHSLEIDRIDQLCDDAVAIRLAVPDELAAAFRFRAGQSLTLRRMVSGVEQRRSYSICAAVGEPPRIGVREVVGGDVSAWLVRRARVGDRLEVQPPAGRFTARFETPGHHVLIGAGSGITPLLSIASTALRQNDQSQVTLLYGNRRAGSVMFSDDIADLKDRFPARFVVNHVLSRESRSSELLSGRLDPARLEALIAALPVVDVDHWWLCGPFGLVVAASELLRSIGVANELVHRELFFVETQPHERPAAGDVRPSGEGASVTVVLDGRTTTATVAPATPILDGVQPTRPDLPFACKGGVCGTCRARLTHGQVVMRRNFALEQAELDAGFILTCQALPTTPTVTVDFDA